MHLADFSYMARFTQNAAVLVLFLIYYGSSRGLDDIRSVERRFSIKMAVFYLTLLSLVGWIIFDILAIRLKYEEGRDPESGCMPKASPKWSEDNQRQLVGIKFYLNIVWTLQSSALFLLLVFLQNLAKPYMLSLGTSREYLFYKIWAPLSFCAYPLLQCLFDFVWVDVYRHTLLGSVTPQLANHAEAIFVSCMLARANCKLRRLAWGSDSDAGESGSAFTLLRFQTACISLLVFFLALDVIGLATINIDVMLLVFADGSGPIYKSAFATDLSVSIFNIGLTGSYVSLLLLLFPPTYFLDNHFAGGETQPVPIGAYDRTPPDRSSARPSDRRSTSHPALAVPPRKASSVGALTRHLSGGSRASDFELEQTLPLTSSNDPNPEETAARDDNSTEAPADAVAVDVGSTSSPLSPSSMAI